MCIRDSQNIHAAPDPADLGTQFSKSLQCGEGIDRRVLQSAAQDIAHHWDDLFRMLVEEFIEHHQALGDPRPRIQEFAGGKEGRQRYLDDLGRDGEAVVLELVSESKMSIAHRLIAEELQLLHRRQADSCLLYTSDAADE